MFSGVLTLKTVAPRRKSRVAVRSFLSFQNLAKHPAGFGFWDHDLKTGRVLLSSPSQELLGHCDTALSFDPRLLVERVHPDDMARITQTSTRAILQKSHYLLEFRIRFEDGTWHWMALRGEVICDPAGQPARTIGTFSDITSHKETDKTLQEQARLLDLIFRHSLDSIALLDKHYNFVRVNESYARSCQRDIDSFAGHNHFELYPSSFREELEPYRLQKKIYSRSARPFVFPDHPEWGTTFWDITMVPILDSGGEIEFFLFTLKDVTLTVQAQQKNQEYIIHLKNLSARLLTVQESERAALARELHDEIGQSLTAVKIRLQSILSVAPGTGHDRSGLAEALSTVSKLLEQVRGLSLDLRPMQLDDLGLRIALTSLVERMADTAGWKFQLDIDLPPDLDNSELELACYRVVQEALTNVMRHAGATRVWVTLRHHEAALQLTIRDNGSGINPALPLSGTGMTHFGLFSMEERVRHLQGEFGIRPGRRGGTEVWASIPLKPAARGTA